MRYRNVHTNKVRYWRLRYLPPAGKAVMIADDGSRWAISAINETPAFDTCWQPVSDDESKAPDDGCGTGGVVASEGESHASD